jgi:hypothetical protein
LRCARAPRVRVGEVCVKTDRGARVKRKPEQVCRAAEWSQWTDIGAAPVQLCTRSMTMPRIPIKMPRTPEIVASLACAPVQRRALRSRQVVCHHARLKR